MRLIDADALKVSVPDTSADIFENCRNCKTLMDWEVKELIDQQPTASPWHRVEEKPKKHGKYPVCWVENGNFYWQEAHYCYYQDGDKWVAWSSYQGDDVEITPDYWMPIELPKE